MLGSYLIQIGDLVLSFEVAEQGAERALVAGLCSVGMSFCFVPGHIGL